MMGPVDYLVVAFPGNQFKGEIVPAKWSISCRRSSYPWAPPRRNRAAYHLAQRPEPVKGGVFTFIAGQVATILRAIGGEYATLTEGVQSLQITVDPHIAPADGREKEWPIATKRRLESLAHEIGVQNNL